MAYLKIPKPKADLYKKMSVLARESIRHRACQILHKKGAQFNQVFNLMEHNSYMQPHLHPGEEKIEKIYVIKGSLCFFYFDDYGKIKEKIFLEETGRNFISVPAFSWHGYVMTSELTLTYETMMGKYNPATWKKLADWAPQEQSEEASDYLKDLHKVASSKTI